MTVREELADESFSVRLLDDGLPEDVAIDTRTARVWITDHEIRASVTAPSTPVNEGSAAVFTVRLTVDGNAAGALNRTGVEVDYAIGGNVTAADYREASTGTVTFLPDEDEATITITTRDDDGLGSWGDADAEPDRRHEPTEPRIGRCESDGRRGFYHDF